MVQTDENLPRRGFLKSCIFVLNGIVASLLAVPGLGYLLTPILQQNGPTWISLGSLQDFAAIKHPRKTLFKYQSSAGYVRTERNGLVWLVPDSVSASGLAAYSAVCSHMGCNVSWSDKEQLFVCPCHAGRYAIDGSVVSGPPPQPLQKLATKVENGSVLLQFQA